MQLILSLLIQINRSSRIYACKKHTMGSILQNSQQPALSAYNDCGRGDFYRTDGSRRPINDKLVRARSQPAAVSYQKVLLCDYSPPYNAGSEAGKRTRTDQVGVFCPIILTCYTYMCACLDRSLALLGSDLHLCLSVGRIVCSAKRLFIGFRLTACWIGAKKRSSG